MKSSSLLHGMNLMIGFSVAFTRHMAGLNINIESAVCKIQILACKVAPTANHLWWVPFP